MALTLIVEDGTGKSDANTYATRAEGDSYHEAHLYATDWSGATDPQKDQALAMATRILDQQFLFYGWKATNTQRLQWPRAGVPDPDSIENVYPTKGYARQAELPSNALPRALVDATCELARNLILKDRTKDPDGEGIASFELKEVLEVEFDQNTKAPLIPVHTSTELQKYGRISGGGTAKIVRA